MTQLTFGSLFAGIGGFDLGFERAGFECRWQVEIDDYATKILEKHWPKVHRERDIRGCSARNLERVDIIAGGFPCQDISYAGLGAGLDGERSGLFFEAIRLVSELQPRAVVLENVAALLTRGLDRVLGTLAEIGYDAEWHCIPAAYVGAPHIRDRVFVLAYASGERQFNGRKKRDIFGSERRQVEPMQSEPCIASEGGQDSNVSDTRCQLRKSGTSKRPRSDSQAKRGSATNDDQRCGEDVADTESKQSRDVGKDIRKGCHEVNSFNDTGGNCGGNDRPSNWTNVADTNEHISCQERLQRSGELLRVSCDTQEDFRRRLSSNWSVEPDICRVAHGIPSRVDRLRGLGNAVVPQVAEFVGKMVLRRLQ